MERICQRVFYQGVPPLVFYYPAFALHAPFYTDGDHTLTPVARLVLSHLQKAA